MTTTSPAAHLPTRSEPRILVELLIVFALTLIPSLIIPELKQLLAFVPLVYLLVERSLRRRPWSELGFRRDNLKQAFTANWHLILLVGVVIQVVVFLLADNFWPALLDHIVSRLPLGGPAQLAPLVVLLFPALLGEELTYRSLLQQRLSWFSSLPAAIALASIVFGLMHLASGDPLVVAFDVGLVVVDSVIFGVIFARGGNILPAWTAHVLGDLVALGLLLVAR